MKIFFLFVAIFTTVFLAAFSIIPKIFAESTTSITKNTDTDFSQGTLSTAAISGSGSEAVVQLSGNSSGGAWYNNSWSYRKKITFNNTTANLGTTAETLTDFPVLIHLTASNFDFSKTQSAGQDIRFTDSSGTALLNYEIEKWDNSGEEAYIWVKVPSIATTDADYVFVYYGNGAASDAQTASGVWDGNFIGVWHMSDTSGTNVVESKGAYNGTKASAEQPNPNASGKIAGAQTYTQGSSRVSTTITNALNDFTVEVWFKDNAVSTGYERLADKNYSSCFWLGRNSSTINSWGGGVREASPPHGVFVTLTDGQWHQVATIRDGTTHYIYGDGGFVQNSNTVSNTACDTTAFGIGAYGNGGSPAQWFGGDIDEVRLSNNARSKAWIAASYKSGTDAFSSFFSEEIAIASSGTWTSPIDSNVIDLIWNGGWGDGTDDGEAFSAVVANVGANSSVTFQMRTAATADDLTSATYKTIGIANSGTTFTKTKADLDALDLPVGLLGRYAQVKATLAQTTGINPNLDSFTISYLKDNTQPGTNASSVQMKMQAGGDNVTLDTWANDAAPYFSWTEGNDIQSGIKGYCLYLGTDGDGNPESSSGLLGTSPISIAGTECGGFLTNQTFIDFATLSYRGDPWMTSANEKYYFNIKAVDKAGNIYKGDPAQFSFYFDNTPPTNPAGLSAPQNFQSEIDGITIYWSTIGATAAVDNHSHVKGYQYKIGSNGNWYGDNRTGLEDCDDLLTTGVYVLDTDYDTLIEGENTFYLRTWDNACKVSANSVIAVLKYSGNAPSEPINLTVDHTTNTENSFAFDWDAPLTYTGQASGITYCYSINSIPSVSSCSWTAETALAADAFATQPSTNTFYVVAKDEAGNINYAAYSSINFTANTPAPGIPRNTDVADISIKATSNWKLAVSWEEPSDVGVGVDYYKIFRSTSATSCSSSFASFSEIGTTGGTSYADTSLSQQDYYYCVKACDSANNCSAVSSTATGYPDGKFIEAAELTSGPTASLITTKRATISWTTDRASDSRVAYGTNSGKYNSEEPSNSTQSTSHEINLTNLSPGTTYRYRAKWTDEDGNIGQSTERSLTTDPAPTVIDPKVTSVGISSATINYTVKGATEVNILYGPTTAFGGLSTVMTSVSETTYTTNLENLIDGTKYYYKINTFDSEGDEYEGNTLTFDTLPRPKISNVRIQQARNTAQPTMLVSWESNTEVSSIVTYYPEGRPEEARDEVNIDLLSGEHKMVIKGVLPETNYILSVKGRDKAGNEAVSDNQRVTTATDTRPPMISSLSIEGSNASSTGSNTSQQISSQLIVTWNTDEAATSQVEFGEGTSSTYAQKTQEDSNLTFNHLVVISGLTPSKVYHLRAVSADKASNVSQSVDTVTVTPKATDNALDLVIGNLSEMFGFLGGLGQ